MKMKNILGGMECEEKSQMITYREIAIAGLCFAFGIIFIAVIQAI